MDMAILYATSLYRSTRESGESSNELAHEVKRLGLAAHGVCGLIPRVIVDQDEHVLKAAVARAGERPGDVGMDQSAG
eukprot:6201637-Pleurochrysis_carterae.AAC.2